MPGTVANTRLRRAPVNVRDGLLVTFRLCLMELGNGSPQLRIRGSLLTTLRFLTHSASGFDRTVNSGVLMRIRALLLTCLVTAFSLIALPVEIE
jgi:hypothetical protein